MITGGHADTAKTILIIASILLGTLMPLTPVQIPWVNMVTSVTVSLALAFEKIESRTMKRVPRSPETPLLNGYFIWRILFVSILIGGGTLLMNLYSIYERCIWYYAFSYYRLEISICFRITYFHYRCHG